MSRTPPHGQDDPDPESTREQITQLVGVLVAVLRWAADQAGVPEREIEPHVAGTLAYLRRHLCGDTEIDAFGFDAGFHENVYLPLLRPLYRRWFRVEVRGAEHLPVTGGGLVVANHSGTIALDSLMTQVAVHDETPGHRVLRLLAADLVFRTPVVGEMARRGGSTNAVQSDARRLLEQGELVGVWPEGYKGVGKPFAERYRLRRFGRGGFVSTALRARTPIIPCAIVGAEETYPMLADVAPLAKLLGVPYFPLTPTFPHLGVLGLIPLPSKWIIDFGPPIDTRDHPAELADDPLVVFDLTEQVRENIQRRLYALLAERGPAFG